MTELLCVLISANNSLLSTAARVAYPNCLALSRQNHDADLVRCQLLNLNFDVSFSTCFGAFEKTKKKQTKTVDRV